MEKVIKECFEKFRNNCNEWDDLKKAMMKHNAKEAWLKDFYSSMNSFQSIYDSNKDIIFAINKCLEKLTLEDAACMFEEVRECYLEDYNDNEFLLHVSKRLLEFFLKTDDYSTQAELYCIVSSYSLLVSNPASNGRNTDISYLLKGMEYLKRYKLLNQSARYRVWIMHYNYIVRCTDYGVISLKEALDCYDELMAFSSRPDIMRLDEKDEKLLKLKDYLDQTMYIGIGNIIDADDDTRRRFYERTKKYFDKNYANIKSMYELPSELYASFLYNDYYEGKINPNQVFEKYLDYFIYKFTFIKNQSDFDADEIIQCINAIIYLTKLGKHVTDSKLINRALDILVDFVQARWLKNNYSLLEAVNEMLSEVCISLLEYEIVGINKEKIITQLLIQRDVDMYIHGRITAEIAVAIYREMSEKNRSFFDDVKSIPKIEWKDYIYYSSMFHDIGMGGVRGCINVESRPRFKDEIERQKRHVEYGTYVFSKNPGLEKYIDAIRGHHSYYNGEDGFESGYNRNETDLVPFIDILSLSIYIEQATDPYFDFEQKSKMFSFVIYDIGKEKDTRFNGMLVDFILQNKPLQKQIETIVTAQRDDIIYDTCHNWEQIKLSKDEDSILNEIVEEIAVYRKNRNKDNFKPYLAKLEHMSRHSQNDAIRGKALYYLMLYHFISTDYAEGLKYEAETTMLLKKTKNRELLARHELNLGTIELMQGNQESAFSHFLNGKMIAERTPECDEDINIANLSIANIYLMNHHSSKANEYFDMVNPEMLRIEDRLNYLCMSGYCCVKLDKYDSVLDNTNALEEILSTNPEYSLYPQFIYLAIFNEYLGNNEKVEKNLEIVRNATLTAEEVSHYFAEMFLLLEFLDKHKRYELMSETIDKYIELVRNDSNYSSFLQSLAQAQIRCKIMMNNHSEYMEYSDLIMASYFSGAMEKATKMEELEKKLMSDIIMREENAEYADNQAILEESVQKAISDSEQKSQFLSSMSHEIRTPVNAILGLNEMILRESNDDEILQYATDIHNAGKQLLGIINDILDYSKIEAGKMEIVPQRYDMGELINDIKNMIEPKLTEKNLQYIVRFNSDIPNVLFGDDLRIKQVLLNLLSNAYKYTKEGFVQFTVDYDKKDEQSIIAKFSVKDTGIGLKPEQIAKLAIPFERFDLVKNRGVEGTGLGMSIVTKLLEQMGSRLNIESEYGKGSVFSFEIEQGVIEWRKIGKIEEARKIFSGNSAERRQLSASNTLYAPKAKILAVDDNAVNLKVVSALLKRTGIQVTTAISGQECLDLCQKEVYNVILLDHMMPEMDGVETLKKIKESGGPNSLIPVIALTANVVESMDDFYVKQGFDALLTKPINSEKMEEILMYHIPEYLFESRPKEQ